MASYTQTGIPNAPMDDEQSASRMMEEEITPAAEPASRGWVVDSVSVKKAKNGGFIVSCSKHQEPMPKDGPGYQSNDYTFDTLAEAVPFIELEFGGSAGGGMMDDPAMPTQPMRG